MYNKYRKITFAIVNASAINPMAIFDYYLKCYKNILIYIWMVLFFWILPILMFFQIVMFVLGEIGKYISYIPIIRFIYLIPLEIVHFVMILTGLIVHIFTLKQYLSCLYVDWVSCYNDEIVKFEENEKLRKN